MKKAVDYPVRIGVRRSNSSTLFFIFSEKIHIFSQFAGILSIRRRSLHSTTIKRSAKIIFLKRRPLRAPNRIRKERRRNWSAEQRSRAPEPPAPRRGSEERRIAKRSAFSFLFLFQIVEHTLVKLIHFCSKLIQISTKVN